MCNGTKWEGGQLCSIIWIMFMCFWIQNSGKCSTYIMLLRSLLIKWKVADWHSVYLSFVQWVFHGRVFNVQSLQSYVGWWCLRIACLYVAFMSFHNNRRPYNITIAIKRMQFIRFCVSKFLHSIEDPKTNTQTNGRHFANL